MAKHDWRQLLPLTAGRKTPTVKARGVFFVFFLIRIHLDLSYVTKHGYGTDGYTYLVRNADNNILQIHRTNRSRTSVNLPESLGRTSTLQASLVVSEMVEPYGSSRTEPGPTHSKVPSMFSAAAPEGA